MSIDLALLTTKPINSVHQLFLLAERIFQPLIGLVRLGHILLFVGCDNHLSINADVVVKIAKLFLKGFELRISKLDRIELCNGPTGCFRNLLECINVWCRGLSDGAQIAFGLIHHRNQIIALRNFAIAAAAD